jgi:peptide/nickel transport system ATP-binding protein/oligopeptide transport system ATP-binding protein
VPLLTVRDLQTHFFTEEGVVRAVDGVSYVVDRGEVLGIVGESGSGKSVSSLSTMRLVPDPPGRIVGGSILFEDRDGKVEDLVQASEGRMRALRGDRVAMIFQDPMTSLNPYLKVSEQLVEVLEIHRKMPRARARDRAIAMLASVGIPDPARRFDDHPHHLSGGMRQRVMIAMALLCEPELLFADEPTTALDVTIQAQILELLRERKEKDGVGIVLITHDLGVVARLADRVAVMYAGKIVEMGPAAAIFADPRHPYTVGLRRSIPRLEGGGGDRGDAPEVSGERPRRTRLVPIQGMPPSLARVPPGCPFAPRCPSAIDVCRREAPPPRVVSGEGTPEHVVRCHVDDVAAVIEQRPPIRQRPAPAGEGAT